jgi:D-serine deaminase-like pyridoxal phosphate-dependent protein
VNLDVGTPAAVVDLDRLESNLGRWQARCDELGLANRPHVKTHKCVEIARLQVSLGAAGVTCQTLYESEVMLDAESGAVVPNHACVVTNLFEELVGIRGNAVELRWPVARGR